MAKFDMKMILEYAKVFEENADMGDPNAAPKTAAGSVARKGGQTIVNAYFTSEEDKNKLIEAGLDLKPMGNDRIIIAEEGTPGASYGIGEFMRLKRQIADNVMTFQNKNAEVEVNFGGLPKIVNLTDPDNKRLWDVETDGFIGNGSEAIVKFDMYAGGSGVRLEAIAVTKLVEYEPQEQSEYSDVWDV